MNERTLVLIKPEGVMRNLIGEIITRFEKAGLKIIGLKMIHPDEKLAGNHYAENELWLKSVGENTKKNYEQKGKTINKEILEIGYWVRGKLIKYLTSHPIVAIVLEGHNAIKHVRKVVGPTEPASSPAGTIRGDYSLDTYQLADEQERAINNIIHASGSVEEAETEIKTWFTENELCKWKRLDEHLLHN